MHVKPYSAKYWQQRYCNGGNSGWGSYGKLAEFKAGVINDFIAENQIQSVVELGCGDGNQLGLLQAPDYLGVDVSEKAIELCTNKYKSDPNKRFQLVGNPIRLDDSAELALSLDVIYHLVEDEVYFNYMDALFCAAQKFVIIYSSNFENRTAAHEREREFTSYVEAAFLPWDLIKKVDNPWPYPKHSDGSLADFYVYGRRAQDAQL